MVSFNNICNSWINLDYGNVETLSKKQNKTKQNKKKKHYVIANCTPKPQNELQSTSGNISRQVNLIRMIVMWLYKLCHNWQK